MIKSSLNSAIKKYRDFSVARTSVICLCLRHRQINGLLAINKSQYFAQPRPIIVCITITKMNKGIEIYWHASSILTRESEYTKTVARVTSTLL